MTGTPALDYAQAAEPAAQHYAFRLDDQAFDAALARIRTAGLEYWAEPQHREPGRLNDLGGGRGLYFADPDGHNMELLTGP